MAKRTPTDADKMKRTVSIELSPDAVKAMEQAVKASGMKKRKLVARVLTWFAAQDRSVCAVILGQVTSQDAAILLRAAAARLAEATPAGPPFSGDPQSTGPSSDDFVLSHLFNQRPEQGKKD